MIEQENNKSAPSLPVRAFRRDIRRLEREIELALLLQTDCCGVTSAQCHLLLELADLDEGSIGDFAAALDVDPSSLSRTADSLVRLGFILRTEDPSNRRRQILRLSDSGKDKAGEIDATCDSWYESLIGDIPAEKRATVFSSIAILADALHQGRKADGSASCTAKNAATKETRA